MIPGHPVWEIERLASELLSKAYADAIPDNEIDIEWVVEAHVGLTIFPIPSLRSAHGTDGVLCRHPDGAFSIAVDENTMDHKVSRYRFTLGEELGHYVLHAEHLPRAATVAAALKAYRDVGNWHEIDRNAKRFSAAVLMPMDTLVPNALRTYAQVVKTVGFGDPEAIQKYVVSLLAKAYVVSHEAMRYRLKAYPARLDLRMSNAIAKRLLSLP